MSEVLEEATGGVPQAPITPHLDVVEHSDARRDGRLAYAPENLMNNAAVLEELQRESNLEKPENRILPFDDRTGAAFDGQRDSSPHAVRHLQDTLARLQIENDQLERRNEALVTSLRQKAVRSSFDEKTDRRASLTDLEWEEAAHQMQALAEENEILIEQRRSLQKSLSVEKNRVQKLLRKEQLLDADTAGGLARLEALESSVEEADKVIEDMHGEVALLREENHNLQNEKRLSSESLRAHEIALADLRKQLQIGDRLQSAAVDHLSSSNAEISRQKQESLDRYNDLFARYDVLVTSIDRVTSATTSTWNTHVQKTIKLSQDLSRDLAKGVVGSSDSTKAFEGALQDLEHNFESTVAALRDQHEAEKQLVRTNYQDELRASQGCVQESRQSFLEQKVASEALINGQRVLESELESLRKQQSIDARAYHSTIDELSRTLTRTQKDRDGLETQLTSFRSALNQAEMRHEREKQSLLGIQASLQDQMNKIEVDLKSGQEDINDLRKQCISLDAQCLALEGERDRLRRQNMLSNDSLKRKFESQIVDLEGREQLLQKTLYRAQAELKDLQANQQRLTDKWQHQLHTSSQQYERLLQESRAQVDKLESEASESKTQLMKIRILKDELHESLGDERKAHERTLVALQKTQRKADASIDQIRHLLSSAAQTKEENEHLQKRLARINLQTGRISKEYMKITSAYREPMRYRMGHYIAGIDDESLSSPSDSGDEQGALSVSDRTDPTLLRFRESISS